MVLTIAIIAMVLTIAIVAMVLTIAIVAMVLTIAILAMVLTKGGPKEGGLNVGQREGLNMQRIESKTQSNRLLLTTPIPWDPLDP